MQVNINFGFIKQIDRNILTLTNEPTDNDVFIGYF